jgi:hypothetical protein
MPDHVSRPETLGLSPGSGSFEICERREHIDKDKHLRLYGEAEELAKMLSGLINSLD